MGELQRNITGNIFGVVRPILAQTGLLDTWFVGEAMRHMGNSARWDGPQCAA